MGLDITAYERATMVRPLTVEQANAEEYEPGEHEVLLYVDWPGRMQHDGMTEGVYRYEGEVVAFSAGSYGGYNVWRDMLADMARIPQAGEEDAGTWVDGPFAELVHFADNEGFIGPHTAAKLAHDFDAWRDRAKDFAACIGDSRESARFIQRYEDWSRALHVAAKGGAVKFH